MAMSQRNRKGNKGHADTKDVKSHTAGHVPHKSGVHKHTTAKVSKVKKHKA